MLASGVCIRLRETVEKLFPEQLEARKQSLAERAAAAYMKLPGKSGRRLPRWCAWYPRRKQCTGTPAATIPCNSMNPYISMLTRPRPRPLHGPGIIMLMTRADARTHMHAAHVRRWRDTYKPERQQRVNVTQLPQRPQLVARLRGHAHAGLRHRQPRLPLGPRQPQPHQRLHHARRVFQPLSLGLG